MRIFIRFVILIVCIIMTIIGAIFLEILLDLTGLEPIKHLIGTIGSILIVLSIVYSFRKRKFIFKSGRLQQWLIIHEWMTIAGTSLVFVHGGFHGHAVVPLLTTGVMFVTVVSGLVGRYLYVYVCGELSSRKKELEEKRFPKEEIENTISFLVITHRAMRHWRTIHIPIVFVLAMMVTFHVLSALYYDGFWR